MLTATRECSGTKTHIKNPTPSTKQFINYLEETIRPILVEKYSRPQVSVLMDLLRFLEQQRYDYSAARAFQTRPISNAAIGAQFNVTERTVRRWMSQLELLGIVERQVRKNPRHSYKNLLNRIGFVSFCRWFKALLLKTPDSLCPPNKKDIIYINLRDTNSESKKVGFSPFPKTGGIRYDRYWKALAEEHLPSGRGRPCMDVLAGRFRDNLKTYAVAFDHPSLTQRWINFCKRANAVK